MRRRVKEEFTTKLAEDRRGNGELRRKK